MEIVNSFTQYFTSFTTVQQLNFKNVDLYTDIIIKY